MCTWSGRSARRPGKTLLFLLALWGLEVRAAPVDYEAEIQPIFDRACAGRGCHIGVQTSGVDLSDYTRTMGSVGVQYGTPIVIPFQPGESPLADKIGGAFPRYGERMPLGGALSAGEIAKITRWIAEGARRYAIAPRRGDADHNGELNLTDAVFILEALFRGGPQPYCLHVADVDGGGSLNLTDAVVLLVHLFLGGPEPPPLTAEETSECETQPVFTRYQPGCLTCHGKIESFHETVDIPCTDCHGGDYRFARKDAAHVRPALPVIMDATTPPLDYDLPYQRFLNPSNLRVVRETCGRCHVPHVDWVLKSLMATGAGHYAGGLYQNGVTDTKTPIYGNFAVRDEDGEVPTEKGAVAELLDLIRFDPGEDPRRIATHYRAVPGQGCARCHLWSRGKGYRGASGAEGLYRADGCAACHVLYSNEGLSESADESVDHAEPGHPRIHRATRRIPTEQCLHCHHRGARIGLSFTGRSQMPPRLPSGPGVPGTTDVRFNGNYHFKEPQTNPPDAHHVLGLHCIDCHVLAGVMGDGNIYGHMDQATKVECRGCHGTPEEPGALLDLDGKALPNLERKKEGVVLTSKVTGREYAVPQVKEIVDPESPAYNPRAAQAMNADHIKAEGGLECASCHSAWMPNCFGCHFERDERYEGINLITREVERGRVRTNNKVFVSLRHFAMGRNAQGRTSPFIVGCQPIADVTAPDGTKILNFAMPETARGLSGLALNPVNPHTTRGRGEVRTCVECHRSPPSLGLGSGNYTLARSRVYAAGRSGLAVYARENDAEALEARAVLPVPGIRAVALLPDPVSGEAEFIYVAGGPEGLAAFDARGGLPENAAWRDPTFVAAGVALSGRHLIAVEEGKGLRVYTLADPAAPRRISELGVPGALRVQVWGVHAFVAAGPEGLVCVDLSDYAAPKVAGSLRGIDARAVRLYAHFAPGTAFAARAYVADPGYGVHVLDLLPDFAEPTRAGGIDLPGALALDTYSRWLPADGERPSEEHDYLYVAAGAAGLHVFDITDPDAIESVASLRLEGVELLDVDVYSRMAPPGTDDFAAAAAGAAGVALIDVTNPAAPELLSLEAPPEGVGPLERIYVSVQPLDRFVDEDGNELKENSHPGARPFTREEIVRILKAPVK